MSGGKFQTTVVNFDKDGHRVNILSEPAPAPLTPSRIADDLNAVLTQLAEKEVILVGFSGSALYAYNYYHRYPQNPRVAGLMGVNPNFVIAVTFAIGAALAAVAGVMIAANYSVAHF